MPQTIAERLPCYESLSISIPSHLLLGLLVQGLELHLYANRLAHRVALELHAKLLHFALVLLSTSGSLL